MRAAHRRTERREERTVYEPQARAWCHVESPLSYGLVAVDELVQKRAGIASLFSRMAGVADGSQRRWGVWPRRGGADTAHLDAGVPPDAQRGSA